MDKLKMRSADVSQKNIAEIRKLFPCCVTEAADERGKLRLVVDFDQLQQELSDHVVDGPRERYRLDWPGKRKALALANTPIPIPKTLRPILCESENFDAAQNLFIEGDNLDALKLLMGTYLGRIKVIYIDPPYNTGSDLIYNDDFSGTFREYFERSGQVSEGNKLVANTEANGRFHSAWLSALYPRLRLARNLLRHDGVIIISISDKEIHNLKHMCDEIFGESNQIGTVVWNSTKSVTNTALISVGHTYNLVYAKDKNYFLENRMHFRLPEDGSGFSNPDDDPRGPWKADPFQVGGWRPNQQYAIVNPLTGKEYYPNPGSSWKNDYEKFKELTRDNRIVFGTSGKAGPQRKRFLVEAEERGKVAKTWWDDVGTTTNGTAHVKRLFNGVGVFSNPKPVDFIERFIRLGDHTGRGIILDFYGGSGTTAEAVMRTNAKGASRKFIIVQIAEEIDRKSKDNEKVITFLTKNKLPLNIAAISKERIRRVAADIHNAGGGGGGVRVLKVDTSNMKDVFCRPETLLQHSLFTTVDNVKPDRTADDLLFQVLVDWGVDLTLPIQRETMRGKAVFFVDGNALVACFDTDITEDLARDLAKHKPLRVVFRDNGFDSDAVKINVEEIFRQFSSTTEVKTI